MYQSFTLHFRFDDFLVVSIGIHAKQYKATSIILGSFVCADYYEENMLHLVPVRMTVV